MNELVAMFNNKIKCKESLRECLEFAYQDDDIGEGDNGKLVAFFNGETVENLRLAKAYQQMKPEDNQFEDTEYLYLISAYTWDETYPEYEMDFGLFDCAQMYKNHKAVVSVHLGDEAIYVHTLVKRTKGLDFYIPDEIPSFSVVKSDVPFDVIQYCEAMDYLMY